MNIELAKITIDKMAFFIPEDVLSDLYKDHDATAEVLAQDANRVVFSIVYHDNKDKRILSITVKRNEINVHYNGTMQVFSHRIDESFYNDVLSVLFDVQAVQPVKINQVEENTMTTFTTKLAIQDQIETLEHNIAELNNEIESKQKEIDCFEYEVSEDDFDEFLDDIEESVTVCGMTFYPSDILKSCDPVAYRCAKADYESNYDLDDIEEYQDLKQELEDLENQLEELEGKLEELETELEDFQNQLDSLESKVIWSKSESRLNGLYWAESEDDEMLSFNSQDELYSFLNNQ